MPYTRFSRDQWWNFFYTVDLVVGTVIGVVTSIVSWRAVSAGSLLLGFLAFMAFGYLLPRLFRYEFIRMTESKGPAYRRDDYIISAAITGWVCSLFITGGMLWILLMLAK